MNTQQRIFQAAKSLFASDGLDGLSIRNVAKDVGVTPMAIYRHYADKDALIDALSAHALDAWQARVAAITAHDPVAWLTELGQAFLTFALEEPRTYEAAFVLPARHARRFPDDFIAGRSPAGRMIFDRIEEARAQGRIARDAGTAEIGIMLWGLGQGLISLYQANRFTSETEFHEVYTAAMRRCLASFIVEKQS